MASRPPSGDQSLKKFTGGAGANVDEPPIGMDEVRGAVAFQGMRNERLRRGLEPHKTIRDPVHGDIRVNRLETELLDTASFQRLRRIKQLGFTEMIFPGATHTRFSHSLGTLYVAQKMLNSIRHNPKPVIVIAAGSYCELLVRTTALLHDLAHVPFGHTLDDEGNLFGSQWENEERREVLLGPASEIGKVLTKWGGSHFPDDVRETLFSKEEVSPEERAAGIKPVSELPLPVVYDVVGNTLCADLLDYLKRDTFYSGLKEDYDVRFLSYLVVMPIVANGPARLVLRVYKPTTGVYRRDVLSELRHLLRLRYSVAEKLYYNRGKIAASAMLTEALSSALARKKELLADILNMGDDDLLTYVENSGDKAAAFLVRELRAHRLYHPVYSLSYTLEGAERQESPIRVDLRKTFHKPAERVKLARKLEAELDLETGSVVLYCPPLKMGGKLYEAKVNSRGTEVASLENLDVEDVKEEVERLRRQHRELWRFYVFAARTVDPEAFKLLQSDCERHLRLKNELPGATSNLNDVVTRRSLRHSLDHPGEPAVSVVEIEALRSASTYGPETIWDLTTFERAVRDVRKK